MTGSEFSLYESYNMIEREPRALSQTHIEKISSRQATQGER